jgi:hypothetical protein
VEMEVLYAAFDDITDSDSKKKEKFKYWLCVPFFKATI